MMRKSISGLSLACFTVFLSAAFTMATDYQHSLTAGKMTFEWSVEGDNLAIRLAAPTKGWVGIGFNPTKKMKGANFVIGYVKNGEVSLFDEFGTMPTSHTKDQKKGGKNNVTIVGGKEEGKSTTLEFVIPLNSDDEMDGKINPNGDTTVLLAYGPDRDSTRMKHSFDAIKTVNLNKGTEK